MKSNESTQFRWIANEIDVSKSMKKLPSYMLEMVKIIENADTENNLPVYVQACDDFEIYTKLLVPDVLTTEEWHMLCAKYSLPE